MTLQSLSPYNFGYAYLSLAKEDTERLLPILLSSDADIQLREVIKRNDSLRFNSESMRKRALLEIRRRFKQMPTQFWEDYQRMSASDQTVALFLVLLKTYRLLFDFLTQVVLPRWHRMDRRLTRHDLRLQLMELAGRDEKINSIAESTQTKVISQCLTLFRQVGLLNREGYLCPLQCSNFSYYLTHGEPWFLEACLVQTYEINHIKSNTIYDHTRVRTTIE